MSYARTAKLLLGALALNVVDGVNAVSSLLQGDSAQTGKPELQYWPSPVKSCSNSVNASNPCEPLTLVQGLEIGAGVVGLGLLGLAGYGLYKCKTRQTTNANVDANANQNAADVEAGKGSYKSLSGGAQGK